MVANLLANPDLLVDVAFTFVCRTTLGAKMVCSSSSGQCGPKNMVAYGCLVMDTLSTFNSVYNDIKQMAESESYFSTEMSENTGTCGIFKQNYLNLLAENCYGDNETCMENYVEPLTACTEDCD